MNGGRLTNFYFLLSKDVDVLKCPIVNLKAITQEGEDLYSLRESFQLLSFPTISRKFYSRTLVGTTI